MIFFDYYYYNSSDLLVITKFQIARINYTDDEIIDLKLRQGVGSIVNR